VQESGTWSSPKASAQLPQRETHGFTFGEVLIVVAIIAVLAMLLFPLIRSSRRGGSHSATISNLDQIYHAMLLYGSSYDTYDEVPGLGAIPARPIQNSNLLFPFGISKDQLHSDAFPASGRVRWGSSFTWYWVTTGGPDGEATARQNRVRLAQEGASYVMVQDTVHDYFEYWSSEKAADPLMQRRYEINLRVNGSVKAERRPGIRGVIVPYWSKP
jgi:prepilin-type N-terminal cleavage/methylation domain-containing protein